MEKIENQAHKVSYTNGFGETMILILDDKGNMWFKHEDCNDEFENFKDLDVKFEIKGTKYEGFKYVLDKDERNVVTNFINECKVIIETLTV